MLSTALRLFTQPRVVMSAVAVAGVSAAISPSIYRYYSSNNDGDDGEPHVDSKMGVKLNTFKYNLGKGVDRLRGKAPRDTAKITSKMREELDKLGYKKADVERMTPADAQHIVENGIKSNISRPKPIIDIPASDVIITSSDGAGVAVGGSQDASAATQVLLQEEKVRETIHRKRETRRRK